MVMRILHKKELGCHAKSAVVLKEEERTTNEKKINVFWELLGGKKGVKCKLGTLYHSVVVSCIRVNCCDACECSLVPRLHPLSALRKINVQRRVVEPGDEAM